MAMKPLLRALRGRFGITAPRVAVRTHVPWHWRWATLLVLVGLVIVIVWSAYDPNFDLAGLRQNESQREISKLNDLVQRQRDELGELRVRIAQAERQLQIERAAYVDVAKQVQTLSEESAGLREDLAFFQSLMPATGRDGTITINRFRMQPETPEGEYRYRLLLVQGGQRARDFQGNVQFVVNLLQEGRDLVLVLPAEGEQVPRQYQLNFRFFQRVEGILKIPPGSTMKSLQVRVFENGTNTPKLTQTVKVS